jgi:hypothetical protein
MIHNGPLAKSALRQRLERRGERRRAIRHLAHARRARDERPAIALRRDRE